MAKRPRRGTSRLVDPQVAAQLSKLVERRGPDPIRRAAGVSMDALDRAVSGGKVSRQAAVKLEAWVRSLAARAPTEVQ